MWLWIIIETGEKNERKGEKERKDRGVCNGSYFFKILRVDESCCIVLFSLCVLIFSEVVWTKL